MNVFIVYYHPEPRSFNGAMFKKAITVLEEEGHEVKVSDLHEQNFNPTSGRHNFKSRSNADYYKQQLEEIHASETSGFAAEIEDEIMKIEWCDLMIWQFPLWWFGLPAPLKGWVDRVFVMGRTYGNGRFYENGVFNGKTAMLSLTTGGPAEAYLSDGFNGDIHAILRPIQRGMLEFVGFQMLSPHIVYGPAHIPEEDRTYLLRQYGERIKKLYQEKPVNIGKY